MSYERKLKALASNFLEDVTTCINDTHQEVCNKALETGVSVDLARLARWRLEDGIDMTLDFVPDVLVDEQGGLYKSKKPIERRLRKHIFAYAALSVVDDPMHPAHCGFWSKGSVERMAALVVQYCYSQTVPIQFEDKQDLVKRVKWGHKHYDGVMATEGLERVQKWMAEHLYPDESKRSVDPDHFPAENSEEYCRAIASVPLGRVRGEQALRIMRWRQGVKGYVGHQ